MNVRVLEIENGIAARQAMERVGADACGISLMAPKAFMRAMLLDCVDNRAANLIKQEMLSLGGDAAVHRDVSRFKSGVSCVLLMGTYKQLTALVARLSPQPFGLKKLSNDVRDALSNYEVDAFTVPAGSHKLRMGIKPLVMGILNVTPDSFFDGGTYTDPARAAERAMAMEGQGAAIIDIGGESTRPGAARVSSREEMARVVPLIRRIVPRLRIPVSIDTYKPDVARAALDAGACIVNDITALRHDRGRMAAVVREYGAALIMMHMQGTPRTMQKNPRYGDVVGDIADFFKTRIRFAVEHGVRAERIVLDPGIGFGKTPDHNLTILQCFKEFKVLGFPLAVGASRKSFIGRILNEVVPARAGTPWNFKEVAGGPAWRDSLDIQRKSSSRRASADAPTERRLYGSIAGALWAAVCGAHVVRVHDVAETVETLTVLQAIKTPGGCPPQGNKRR